MSPLRTLAALTLLSLGACRSGLDEPCRCASDCRGGLECFAVGEKVLKGDECYPASVRGTCVVAESIDTDSGEVNLTEMPIREDLHSRRDLADSGTNSASGTTEPTGTGTGTTTSTSTTTTGTTTGTTTDTTGTTTTGTTTTGTGTTTTGTTGTGTGTTTTTGTTTDTSGSSTG